MNEMRSGVRVLVALSVLFLAGCGRSDVTATALPTHVPQPTDSIAPEIRNWLRQNAIPFTTTEPSSDVSDLIPLKEIIGDARIVALGEATHGTHEFFQMKHRILEFLVQEMGFTVFALEASWPEADLINDYVHTGQGDPAQLLAGLGFWTWNTQEVLDLIQWMRAYNQTRGDAPALSFVGFDMQAPRMAIARVLTYLNRVDPGAVAQADTWFGCIRPYQTATQGYATLSQDARDRCRQDLQAVHNWLLRHQANYTAATSPADYAQALHSARVVQQFEDVFAIGAGNSGARDRYMAENIAWLLGQAGTGTRMIVWAHNGHVGVYSAPQESMGAHLRRQSGAALVSFGQTFYSGSFNALTMTGPNQLAGLAEHEVAPPPENSYEYYFHSAGLPRFFLDLRGFQPGTPGTDWLFGPLRLRYIGAGYREASAETFFETVALPQVFDVMVYFDDTSPSHLLVPETALNTVTGPVYPSQPGNLGFEDGTAHWALFSDRAQDYTFGATAVLAHSGTASGYIGATTDAAAGFASLLQTVAADAYRGQRLRMSAYVRTDVVSGGSGVILRLDGPESMLAIRNMQDHPILGTTGWTRYEFVLDVPQDTVNIAFGVWLTGFGHLQFDDFRLEVVGPDVPTTP